MCSAVIVGFVACGNKDSGGHGSTGQVAATAQPALRTCSPQEWRGLERVASVGRFYDRRTLARMCQRHFAVYTDSSDCVVTAPREIRTREGIYPAGSLVTLRPSEMKSYCDQNGNRGWGRR